MTVISDKEGFAHDVIWRAHFAQGDRRKVITKTLWREGKGLRRKADGWTKRMMMKDLGDDAMNEAATIV